MKKKEEEEEEEEEEEDDNEWKEHEEEEKEEEEEEEEEEDRLCFTWIDNEKKSRRTRGVSAFIVDQKPSAISPLYSKLFFPRPYFA